MSTATVEKMDHLSIEADLRQQVVHLLRGAQFRIVWPEEIKQTFVRVLDDGPSPSFNAVRDALYEAKFIERKMSKDIEKGEELLPRHKRF